MKQIPIKEINRLAFPALVSGIIEPVISLTDTIMAGHILEDTKDILGAVGIVSSFITALVWIFIQGSKAISAQISYAYGQNRIQQMRGLVAQVLNTVLNQVWLFSVFLFDGFCSAGGVISGRLYSSEQFVSIRYMVRDLFFIVVGIGSAIALVYFMFYIQIGEWLTKDTDIRHLFYQTFWIVVLMQPINAMAFLFDGFYKGLGFTQTLRNSFLIATFLGFFPIYFFVEHVYHWGLMGIWVALLTWMLFRGGILILHYKAFFVTPKGIIR